MEKKIKIRQRQLQGQEQNVINRGGKGKEVQKITRFRCGNYKKKKRVGNRAAARSRPSSISQTDVEIRGWDKKKYKVETGQELLLG